MRHPIISWVPQLTLDCSSINPQPPPGNDGIFKIMKTHTNISQLQATIFIHGNEQDIEHKIDETLYLYVSQNCITPSTLTL